MIDIIEAYDANYYILSHESLCDREEMNVFWKQLKLAGRIVGEDTSVEIATKSFLDEFHRAELMIKYFL